MRMNNVMPDNLEKPARKKTRWITPWIYDVLLLYILVIGGVFRYVGITWGGWQYLHPDERFLVWVGSDIQPISTPPEALGTPPNTINNPWRAGPTYTYPDCTSWGGYFDASCSPLNPNNRGHPFYVYGTLPMFVTRYMVQWIYGHSGFNEMTVVGRSLSALIDLLSVVLVYAIGSRLFKKPVGLLAAAFAAFTVLNIQQSHFFTMDTFFSFFTLLAVYFAVRVSLVKPAPNVTQANELTGAESGSSADELDEPGQTWRSYLLAVVKHPYFGLSIAFGVALGCAVASKLSAAPVAFVLPVAFGVVIWRKPARERSSWLVKAAIYLGTAAFVSLLVFRIFQPYAFLGPGFFGLRPNPQWVSNIKEQRLQAAGDIDFPPSLQWARRPVWFSAQNMVAWGLGLPLGILAFAGFLWAGLRMLKGDWQKHAVLWLWGGFYFVWQSLQFNPTMRYQLPTYPVLAIYAGWGLVELWNLRSSRRKHKGDAAVEGGFEQKRNSWARPLSALLGGVVLMATFAWAVAFSLIYARPITRVAASDWIYQNIPGPINLHIQGANSLYNQPLSIPYGSTVQAYFPLRTSFTANANGTLNEVYLGHVADVQTTQALTLSLSLFDSSGRVTPLMSEANSVSPMQPGASTNEGYLLKFDTPVNVTSNQVYTLNLGLVQGSRILDACGPVSLSLQTPLEMIVDSVAGFDPCIIQPGRTYSLSFTPHEDGLLEAISLSQLIDQTPISEQQTLEVSIGPTGDEQQVAVGSLSSDFSPGPNGLGNGYLITLNRPVTLEQGRSYSLSLTLSQGNGVISVQGSTVANEGDWDDGLPLRVNGYDAFGGIYIPGLNFNMYTDDNIDKLDHFISVYDQAEYIFISSNRQWGSLPRLPERFPMSSLHYRHLLGCPDDRTIGWCYSVAVPGMFQGDMGFQLVAVFQSDPSLGPININDQFAEEAFTVYDHPKVLVFKKTADYNSAQARSILSQANFNEIVRITPKKAAFHPANLKLPEVQLDVQSEGGTWSQLFNPQAWLNRFEFLGVIVWYLSVAVLGLLVYPILRITLPGLKDRGYPLARTAGMLILAYFTWLAGSVNIPFNRLTITIVILLMVLAAAILAYRQRDELRQEWHTKRNYFLVVEGLALGFFLFFLLVRFGNPDLWHPFKGGEKPMDFSFFNAVLKSTTFPPYDPWYAGGYMNYYYWGFVFVGVLVKWLGIVPAFAYNLIIPTLFSLVAMGAFCIGYNLSQAGKKNDLQRTDENSVEADQSPPNSSTRPYLIGIATALGMAVLGNLGTLRMIVKGWEQLGISGGLTASTGFFTRVVGLFNGLGQTLFHGASLPYSLGDWYWIPSRAIPAPGDVEPITEFPMFTFLYADLHAHMMALAIAMLAIAWVVAVLFGKARWQSLAAGIISIGIGGLAIGALYPANLSDIYTYLPLGMLVLGYTLFRYADINGFPAWFKFSGTLKRLIVAVLGMLLLAVLAYELYLPYRLWYGQPYSSVIPWNGTHTPLVSYLTHWGLFLFLIVSWMVWETREWMAHTPLVSLRKLEKYSGLIAFAGVVLFLACLLLSIKIPGIESMSLLSKLPIGRGASVSWFILPLAAWAGVLLLQPGLPDAKRLVLFLVGTGLLITLVVEIVVVQGDIGRMNTVFKFYLQVWALFALSAAAALGWLLEPVRRWLPRWRVSWQIAFGFLVFSAALFTLYGTMAKIKDRWVPTAPHTLDGMAYMSYATYFENYPGVTENTPVAERGIKMDLSQDYRAIRWMQENIQGSPVIVEANSPNLYRWYSRFTIYTGLPGVLGWQWHEQQQRVFNPDQQQQWGVNPYDWVTARLNDIDQFYNTVDTDQTRQFLNLYNVRYIIVGQLEEAAYPGPGLDKFPAFNGILWNQVYHDENTTIYEVIP
jgi:YYY domain-containing protein